MYSAGNRAFTKHKPFKKHKQDLTTKDYSKTSPMLTLSDLETLHEIPYTSKADTKHSIILKKSDSSPDSGDLLRKLSNYEGIFSMIRGLFESEKKRIHPDIIKEANNILSQIEVENIDLCDRETRPSDTPVASTGDSFLDRLAKDPHLLEKYFDKMTTELAEQDLEIQTLKQELTESDAYIDQLYASNQTLKEELFKKEKNSRQSTIIKRKSHHLQKSCGLFERDEISEQQREYLADKGKTNSNLYQPHEKIIRKTLHY